MLSILALCVTLISPSATALKVGVVDLQQAIQATKKGKSAKSKLEKDFKKQKDGFDKEDQKFKKEVADFQKKSAVLSADARKKKEVELQRRRFAWQQKVQQAQLKINQEEAKLTAPILKGLRELVPSISKKSKVKFVFEKNSSGLLHAEEQVDLTKDLVAAFDKKFKK